MIANLKVVAFKEAILFLKQKTELVEKMLTLNHQKVVKQFMAHKHRSARQVDKCETILRRYSI